MTVQELRHLLALRVAKNPSLAQEQVVLIIESAEDDPLYTAQLTGLKPYMVGRPLQLSGQNGQ